MTNTTIPHNIILIDAECLLCHGFAKFIIRHDRDQKFKFGALQDQKLQTQLQKNGITYPNSDSVLVYTGSVLLVKSRAVLYVLSQLPRYRARTQIGYIIPRTLSDKIYDLIARHRKKRFGEDEGCDLTTTKLIRDRLV